MVVISMNPKGLFSDIGEGGFEKEDQNFNSFFTLPLVFII